MSIEQPDRRMWETLYSHRAKVIGYLRSDFHRQFGQPSLLDSFDESLRQNNYYLYEEDYENIFQDAIIFIRDNTQKGKIELENVYEQPTYITRVCLYKMKELLRKKKYEKKYSQFIGDKYRQSQKTAFQYEKADQLIALSPENKYLEAEKGAIIKRMVLNMASPCNGLLQGFYWDGLTIKELAAMFCKGNENVTKVTKHRCCEKFKNAYLKQIKKGGLHE